MIRRAPQRGIATAKIDTAPFPSHMSPTGTRCPSQRRWPQNPRGLIWPSVLGASLQVAKVSVEAGFHLLFRSREPQQSERSETSSHV